MARRRRKTAKAVESGASRHCRFERMEERQMLDADPIRLVAEELFEDGWLLCFDEFHVTDIADAMILGRLFKGLFEQNVVVVATSNAHPQELYKNGLNRQLFVPFLTLLEARMEVLQLAAAKDYRLEKLHGSDFYLTPADARAEAAMDASFRKLTGRTRGEKQTLRHKGRSIVVPQAALGVARFSFADLCEAPLGPLDYQRIAHSFHTLMIEATEPPSAPASDDGLVRDWPAPDFGIEKHQIYMVQWYAFAVLAIVLWIVLNLRRTKPLADE